MGEGGSVEAHADVTLAYGITEPSVVKTPTESDASKLARTTAKFRCKTRTVGGASVAEYRAPGMMRPLMSVAVSAEGVRTDITHSVGPARQPAPGP